MAGDLYKVIIYFIALLVWFQLQATLVTSGTFLCFIQAQQSLDLIQGELSKVTDNADELIENSSLTSQRVRVWGSLGVVTAGGLCLCMYSSEVVTLRSDPAIFFLTGGDR